MIRASRISRAPAAYERALVRRAVGYARAVLAVLPGRCRACLDLVVALDQLGYRAVGRDVPRFGPYLVAAEDFRPFLMPDYLAMLEDATGDLDEPERGELAAEIRRMRRSTDP